MSNALSSLTRKPLGRPNLFHAGSTGVVRCRDHGHQPLLTILKPPPTPRDSGTPAGWADVARRIGKVLPGDYMKFIELYGSGTIADWLTVLNPFAPSDHENLFVAAFEFLATLREVKTEFPEEVPFPLFYEPHGLLPWASSTDGDLFCWSTRGSPASGPSPSSAATPATSSSPCR
jgi:hypothetical protein